MTERELQNQILLALSADATVFRVNTGQGWAGRATKIPRDTQIPLHRGDVVIRQGRPLHAGLTKGGSDIVGWKPVVITPEMVGELVAVFVAVECKRPGARQTPEQKNFIEQVKKAGGYAGFAESVDQALDCLRRYP